MVVLVLANLVRRKGVDVLLEAISRAQLARTRLWIAGDGEERTALEAQCAHLGLGSRVRFLGRQQDKAGLILACDVLCLPSRREGMGVAALEALALGRPVLASAVGGLCEAVEDERSGLLVPPEDPAALAAALKRLESDPALRARLGAGGEHSLARGYRAENMVEDYAQLYRSVLAECRP
jgi:glycosyltransferase involved in cell wall biosynthesis